MSERITIQQGDYILLSDIPNEQVFNLVKNCFKNAGFTDMQGSSSFAQYNERTCWDVILLTESKRQCFGDVPTLDDYDYSTRRLTLSDVLNSTNGGYDWEGKAVIFTGKHVPVVVKNLTYSNTGTSWYEAGELPPVGCIVDVTGDVLYGQDETNCEVIAHVEDYAVIKMSYGLRCFQAENLKPAVTDREKAIDLAFSKLTEFRSAKQVLGELYDTGMLKGI